jgi:flagellar FliL protein
MSDEPKQEAAQPAKRGSKIVIIAAVLAMLGGGAAGVFALGPMLRGGDDAAASAESGDAGETDGHGKAKGGGGHGGSGSPLFSIDNLVINPAGSQGTRFLIVTVALELKDADATPELTARDPEIRDLLLSLLSARTVEQLSDLGGRDALKEEIRVAIEKVLGPGKVVRVFIPQYVLQ